MRKLLGTILIVVLLVVIFLLASPVYYGKQAQFFINKAVTNANQHYGKYGADVSVVNYHRSWYTSTAVLDVTISNMKLKKWYKQYINPKFNLQTSLVYKEVLTVSHGPIMYHYIGGNPFSAAYLEGIVELPLDLKQRLGLTAPILVFKGSISYAGVFTGNVDMPAFAYDSPEMALKFKGLSFMGSMSSDLSHFAGDYTVQPVNVNFENMKEKTDVQVSTSPVQAQFDFTRTPMGLWVGDAKSATPHELFRYTTMEDHKPHRFVVRYEGVLTHVSLALVNNHYSVSYHTSMAGYQAFSKVKVTHVKVNVEVNNLNASVAESLQELILRSVSTGDVQFDKVLTRDTMHLLPRLITNKTMVNIKDISFDLPKGSVKINGQFAWPSYEPGMPLVTMGMITHASLNVSVGKALLDQVIAEANQIAKEQAAKEEAAVKPSLPVMEPGPVLLSADHKPLAAVPVKKELAKKTAPESAVSPYLNELSEADGFLKFCLMQGYVVEKDNAYEARLKYAADILTANGKQVRL